MSRIRDGFPTTISFADFPTVDFLEISVTPGGIEGGGANDTTTMRNLIWRTMQPKKLKTLSEGSFTAAYKSEVFDTIVAMINHLQILTVTFPDGSTYAFWGWLDNFSPNELVEGEQPTAEVTFIPSNQDTSFVEVDPIYTAA